MTRHVFDEVAVKATRRWTDANGKKRQQTKKFWQTINPFNKNADGSVKTATQIRAEVIAERDAWLKEPQQ
jgi:hypothetical protein